MSKRRSGEEKNFNPSNIMITEYDSLSYNYWIEDEWDEYYEDRDEDLFWDNYIQIHKPEDCISKKEYIKDCNKCPAQGFCFILENEYYNTMMDEDEFWNDNFDPYDDYGYHED